VLANLKEAVRGVREAFRVLKPGGVIGVKDFDHGGDLIYPADSAIEKYGELYVRMRLDNGHDPNSGRKIGTLLIGAGFSELMFSAVYETFTGPRAAAFAQLSIGLLTESWGDEFTTRGWATKDDIQEMIDAWANFANTPGAIFGAAWCEAVARKP
jgi:hypothetical protein